MIIVDDKVEVRYKRGDVREDGKIFWGYGKMYKDGEYWLSKEKFELVSSQRKKTSKQYIKNNTEKHKAYLAVYREKNRDSINAKEREYVNKNRNKTREIQRNYYNRNKSKILRRKQQARLNNIEHYREKDREYIKKNPEKHRVASREWSQKNKQRSKENLKSWIIKNKDRYKVLLRKGSAKRRALINKQSINLTESQVKIVNCFYDQAQRLENKIGIKFHVDHITPIARGGKHEPSNLQVMPATLNIQKHAREIYKWAELQQN